METPSSPLLPVATFVMATLNTKPHLTFFPMRPLKATRLPRETVGRLRILETVDMLMIFQ